MTMGPMTELETRIQRDAAAGIPTVVPEVERTGPQAQVSIAFLCALLLRPGACTYKGLVLIGATITGMLDCSDLTIVVPLRLLGCQFHAPVVFSRSHLRLLDLRESHLPYLAIDEVTVEQSVLLQGAIVGAPHIPVVIAGDELNTGHSIDLSLAKIMGEVRLLGATIGGRLSCRGARIEVKGGNALSMDGVAVKGGVFLDEGFTATGEVRLIGATIRSSLSCKGARIEVKKGNALSMAGANVKGSVALDEGFTATGLVMFNGATIGGQLSCKGATIEVEEGSALSMDGANVKIGAFLDEGFTATGEVRLLGATVSGQLSCRGARIEAKGDKALSMDGANVKGNVFLDEGFTAIGEVRLLGATIDGQLICKGAMIEVKKGNALTMDGANVMGNVLLTHGFAAITSSKPQSSSSSGDDVTAGAAMTRPTARPTDVEVGSNTKGIVSLKGTKLSELKLENADGQSSGFDIILILSGATYTAISAPLGKEDESWFRRATGWIRGDGELRLDPGRLYRSMLTGQQEMALLSPQEAPQKAKAGVYPATYDVMARVLRETGEERLSTQLLIEKQRQLRKYRSWPSRVLSWLFWDVTVGYGYRPRLALLWAAVVYVAASLVFLGAVHHGGIVATPLSDATGVPKPLHTTSSYPSFSAWNYALGSLLSPFVQLPGIDAWRANTLNWWGMAARLTRWFEPVVMWGLVLALGTSLTRMFTRDRN